MFGLVCTACVTRSGSQDCPATYEKSSGGMKQFLVFGKKKPSVRKALLLSMGVGTEVRTC